MLLRERAVPRNRMADPTQSLSRDASTDAAGSPPRSRRESRGRPPLGADRVRTGLAAPRIVLALPILAAAGCGGGDTWRNPAAEAFGDPAAGAAIIRQAGCGGCHTIPGIRGAKGTVGPPLDFFSRRMYIAGRITNTPENLTTWILDPPSIDPQTAMPNLQLEEAQARAVAAYLYTLK
jgi:mono/diheme cytochrome c family protein